MFRRMFVFSVLILGGIFLCLNFSLAANNLDVVINEIAWMGTPSQYNEWIELKNNTGDEIDLTGWILSASTTVPKFSIPLKNLIGSGGYYLLERSGYEISIPADATSSALSLINTGMSFELFDSNSNLIDGVGYPANGWWKGINENENKRTMERVNPLMAGDSGNWQNSFMINGTPRAVNYLPPINLKPIARAGLDQIVKIGDQVYFDGRVSADSDGIITNYDWDFGDGASATGATATHVYTTENIFTAMLKVADSSGATSTDFLIVTVNALPVATSTPTSTPPTIHPSDVVINEFVSDPGTGGKEWLELYNNTTSAVNLTGWYILEGSGATTTISGQILAKQFFIIEEPEGNLNNAGDIIILKNSVGQIIDQVAYGSWDDGNISNNAPATDDPNSIARNINGLDANNDQADFSETMSVTKNSENVITSKINHVNAGTGGVNYIPPIPIITPTSTPLFNAFDVVINELVSDPIDSEKEWVELFNNTTKTISLAGWKIEEGSKTLTSLSGSIEPKKFFVIENIKGNLNNAGDVVILKDLSGKIIDQIAYGKWNSGTENAPLAMSPNSLARKFDGFSANNNKNDFSITASITKGLANIIKSTQEEENIEDDQDAVEAPAKAKTVTVKKTTTAKKVSVAIINIDLENIRDLNVGDKVITRGFVSVEPGVLGAQFFYLAGSGIQVYSYKKDFPGLKVGNYIEVIGEISESGGERRIKTATQADIKILDSSVKAVTPHQISLAEAGEEYEGSLVKIEGEVIDIKGSSIYLDDGSDESQIYLKQSAGLSSSGIKVGGRLAVTGIVSQTKTGYRILPRYQSDIEIIKTGEVAGAQDENQATSEPTPKSNWAKYLFAIIVFMMVVIIYLVNKLRVKKK